MRSAALRFCPVLLLLFAKVHLGSAAAVRKRDRTDCPRGTYLANNTECLPCKKDLEYTEYPNDFPKCLSCRTCREDQVEVSPCIPTRNTQCACKNGTFCLPDHPCEMCQKCQTRCPKGQMRIAPCTQHSDLLCGPPLDTSSTSSSSSFIILTVLLAVVVGILLVVVWWCNCRHHAAGDGGELSRKPSVVVNRLLQRLGIQDNRCNEQIYQNQQQQQQLLAPVQGSEVPRGVELENMDPRTSKTQKLVPVPGQDPIALLRHSFDTFVDWVPFPEWKRFGRALDLLENDLYLAEQHDRGSREPFYQMLNTWLNKQGSKASVNTLLETLPRIGLNGVADSIASELIKEGYFQYEVS